MFVLRNGGISSVWVGLAERMEVERGLLNVLNVISKFLHSVSIYRSCLFLNLASGDPFFGLLDVSNDLAYVLRLNHSTSFIEFPLKFILSPSHLFRFFFATSVPQNFIRGLLGSYIIVLTEASFFDVGHQLVCVKLDDSFEEVVR